VAIKRVAHAHPGDRAHREALATARLAHPAIASLYEARTEGESLYLISELVGGEALDKLALRGELEDQRVLEIGVAVCEALEHAHARGVVHRDVKPANIIVLPDADAARERVAAKLTDFGSARICGEDALTHTGDVLGTLAYMAPEQSEGEQATPASDHYAVALVLYEALSGVNPRRGPTPAATARRLVGRVPPIARYRPDVPYALREALDRALSPHPRDRGALAELRQALLDSLGQRAKPPRRLTLLGRRWRAGGPRFGQDREPARARHEAAALAPSRSPRLAVARVFWWAGALAAIIWQALSGHAGLALLLCAFALPLIALPRRAGPGWLAASFAPLLGILGLAGAFPALAGQAATVRARAGLAALGYWWLLLAQPLIGRRLWLWAHDAQVAHAGAWRGSPGYTATHVLRPLLTVGVLEGAAVWALAAAVLPRVVRGRSASLDIVAATVWAAALASAQSLVDGGFSAHGAHATPRGAVLGAILCGALAVCARALRGPVTPRLRPEGGVT
jgi:hypothetical protein